jgi:hypothetical protein
MAPRSLVSRPWTRKAAFKMAATMPDNYLLIISALPEDAYVKSIRLGGLKTIDSGLDLTYMETVRQGDGDPASGSWVGLVPDPPRVESMPRFKYATPTEDGRFGLTGAAPGEYRLYPRRRAEAGRGAATAIRRGPVSLTGSCSSPTCRRSFPSTRG